MNTLTRTWRFLISQTKYLGKQVMLLLMLSLGTRLYTHIRELEPAVLMGNMHKAGMFLFRRQAPSRRSALT